MQSELSCHIGPMGKFFCRICNVKGFDNDDEETEDNTRPDGANSGSLSARAQTPLPPSPTASVASDDNGPSIVAKKLKRKTESMGDMVARATRFFKVFGFFINTSRI